MSKGEIDFRTKLDFLKMDGASKEALRDFRAVLEKQIDGILGAFYGHVGAIPELRQMLGSDSNIARVRGAQAKHWLNLFTAEFDGSYFEAVKRIGDARQQGQEIITHGYGRFEDFKGIAAAGGFWRPDPNTGRAAVKSPRQAWGRIQEHICAAMAGRGKIAKPTGSCGKLGLAIRGRGDYSPPTPAIEKRKP